MAKAKGTSSQSSQNPAFMGEQKEQLETKPWKSLVFLQPKQSEMAGSVGASVTALETSALE